MFWWRDIHNYLVWPLHSVVKANINNNHKFPLSLPVNVFNILFEKYSCIFTSVKVIRHSLIKTSSKSKKCEQVKILRYNYEIVLDVVKIINYTLRYLFGTNYFLACIFVPWVMKSVEILLILMSTTIVVAESLPYCSSLTLNDSRNWMWEYLHHCLKIHRSFYKCKADEWQQRYFLLSLHLFVAGAVVHLRRPATTRHRRAHPTRPPSRPDPPF